MNKKLKLLLSILAISSMMGVVASCGGSSKEPTSSPTESSTPSTPDESTPDESTPDESTPDESTPDESTPDESTPDEVTKYVVKFVNDDESLISEEEYEEGATVTVPADPTKEDADGYTYTFAGWDQEVTAANGDVTYKATYTKTAIEYTIAFTHPRTGMILAAPIKYTVENVAEIAFPEVPAELAMEGYTVAWDKTAADITTGDVNVSPVWTAIEYTVAFTHPRTGMPLAEPIKYTVETMGEVVFPEVPADFLMEGYTVAWDKTPADLGIGGLNVTITMTANTYKVTYDANGGSMDATEQDIVFGAEYTLATATPAKAYETFIGWADEKGNMVAASGMWEIPSNVTLKAVYSDAISFEDGVVPAAFTVADDGESLSVVEKDGGKVLQIANKNQAPAMKVTLEFLKQYFDDESVDYIAFDAKADINNNNFRRDTNRNNALTAVTYEQDMTYDHDSDGDGAKEKYPTTGVRSDAWKTFYFSRADYDFWVSQNVTAARFIASGGMTNKAKIYLDNIRPVTAAERTAGIGSFESAGIRINDAGKTLLFYTLDQGGTWQFNMMVGSGVFTNVGLTNETVADGIAALTFTKGAGSLSINMTNGKAFTDGIVKTTGYWAVDVYVPEGTDAKMSYHTTTWPGVTLKQGGWTTIYVADSKNQLTLTDTTGGTYCIDNIRSISEMEYNLAALSFEANVGGIRTKELDSAAHSTPAYYYGGADHAANKFSFAFTEGNTDKDAAAIGNVRFENEITYDGGYSLAIEKGAGYTAIQMRDDSKAFELLQGGFTFWIYSTVDIDGVNTKNFINGCNELLNGGEGIYIKANTWTQITITAADMNPTRFLIMQGSWAGTIYIDGFQPLN